MNEFEQKIQSAIKNSGLQFPGIDEEFIVEKTLASAVEFVLSNIAADLLSRDDQDLFRDAYLSAPDIFDADEFLSQRIPDYNIQVNLYFQKWLEIFKKGL